MRRTVWLPIQKVLAVAAIIAVLATVTAPLFIGAPRNTFAEMADRSTVVSRLKNRESRGGALLCLYDAANLTAAEQQGLIDLVCDQQDLTAVELGVISRVAAKHPYASERALVLALVAAAGGTRPCVDPMMAVQRLVALLTVFDARYSPLHAPELAEEPSETFWRDLRARAVEVAQARAYLLGPMFQEGR